MACVQGHQAIRAPATPRTLGNLAGLLPRRSQPGSFSGRAASFSYRGLPLRRERAVLPQPRTHVAATRVSSAGNFPQAKKNRLTWRTICLQHPIGIIPLVLVAIVKWVLSDALPWIVVALMVLKFRRFGF